MRGNVFGSLTGEIGRKASQWFRGKTVKKDEKLVAKSCDFGDPSKLAFCPPIVNPFRLKDEHITAGSANLSDCVDHPNSPGCFNQKHLPASSPVLLISKFPVGSIPTAAPTKNDCYGSMAGDPCYCPSEMPSISNEPSELPTGIPFVHNKPGEHKDIPSAQPSQIALVPEAPTGVPPPSKSLHSFFPSSVRSSPTVTRPTLKHKKKALQESR
jgi:hypothetical protein